MKKALLIAFAVLMVAGSISAAPFDRTYIGLYASDLTWPEDTLYVDNHSLCNWMEPRYSGDPFDDFELWIWILPSNRGVRAIEFKLLYPTGIYLSAYTKQNPDITIANGNLGEGIIATYGTCQMDWVWAYHFGVTSRNEIVRKFQIAAHPLTGLIQAAGCDEDFTLERMWPLTHLYMYSSCLIGTKEASWGAIKSLF